MCPRHSFIKCKGVINDYGDKTKEDCLKCNCKTVVLVSECLLWLLYTYIIPAENMSSWVMEYQFQTSKGYVSRNSLICQQNKTILNKIKVCNKTLLDEEQQFVVLLSSRNESSFAPRCGFRQQIGSHWYMHRISRECFFSYMGYCILNHDAPYLDQVSSYRDNSYCDTFSWLLTPTLNQRERSLPTFKTYWWF